MIMVVWETHYANAYYLAWLQLDDVAVAKFRLFFAVIPISNRLENDENDSRCWRKEMRLRFLFIA